jgi:integrase
MSAISKRLIDSEPPRPREFFLWDDRLAGFGVRVHPTGRKVFIAQVRVGRTQRRIKIGAYGPFTVEQAREAAREIIRAAAEGRDPQREKRALREAVTVEELCRQYLDAARSGLVATRFNRPKRPSTVALDEGRIAHHIVPLIGSLTVDSVRRSDVQLMMDAIAAGKTAGVFKGKPRGRSIVTGGTGTAVRAAELLGGIYSWAEKRDLVTGPNPVRGVEKIRGEVHERIFNADELAAIGKALKATARASMAASAVRLIALTGMRRSEACELKWGEIDEPGHCVRLQQTKTGRSVRPIGKAALDLLHSLSRADGCEWVFPRADESAPAELIKTMKAIFAAAGLGLGAQILRRTFASVASDAGFGDATIAELLGHSRRGVTERHYVRRSDPIMIAAADKVAGRIAALLAGNAPGIKKTLAKPIGDE